MRNAKIQRLAIMLSECGYKIEYRQGKLNEPVDTLSRLIVSDEGNCASNDDLDLEVDVIDSSQFDS